MIFVCLNGSFNRIDSVIRWFDKLPLALLLCEVPFDGVGCLVVRDIEFWFGSLLFETGEHFFEAFNDGRIRLIFDRDDKYIICVIVICHKIILVAI